MSLLEATTSLHNWILDNIILIKEQLYSRRRRKRAQAGNRISWVFTQSWLRRSRSWGALSSKPERRIPVQIQSKLLQPKWLFEAWPLRSAIREAHSRNGVSKVRGRLPNTDTVQYPSLGPGRPPTSIFHPTTWRNGEQFSKCADCICI